MGSVVIPGHMGVDARVVQDGNLTATTGRLVRNDLGDCFEPAFPVTEKGGVQRRARPVKGAVHLTGADFDATASRLLAAGVVEGWTTVTGPGPAGAPDRAGRASLGAVGPRPVGDARGRSSASRGPSVVATESSAASDAFGRGRHRVSARRI